MSYRNKTYVAFDGDNDIKYYYIMKAWKQSDKTDFNFYDAHDINTSDDASQVESIKKQLRERMANSKMFILLLGERTKMLTKFVKWEVEHAIYLDLPIIVANINKKRCIDNDRMPKWLENQLCIVCSFEARIIQYSLECWGDLFLKLKKEGNNQPRQWLKCVYDKLGL